MPKMRGKFNVLKDGQYVEILVEQAEKDANGNVINDTYASIDDLLDRKGHSSSERTREKMKNGTNN